MSGSRLIVGNLDAEERLTGGTLSSAALAAASAYATLLRAFAEEGDRLWTPIAIDPGRLACLPGVPVPELESGPLESAAVAERVLAWGESAAVVALRPARDTPPEAPEPRSGLSLDKLVWELPPAPPDAFARANHRGLCLALSRDHDWSLPGARWLTGLPELEEHLADGGAQAAPRQRWVLKAPWSAAGRGRLIGSGDGLDEERRRAVDRLFQRHGALLFEPWMERLADFGLCGVVTHRTAWPVSFHALLVDDRGRFQGLRLWPHWQELPGIEREDLPRIEAVFQQAATRLVANGYQGPFGIDFWRYDHEGESRLHIPGEINARLSFGFVGRALIARLADAGVLDRSEPVTLRTAFREPPLQAPGGRWTLPLLRPTPEAPGSAWLEVGR